MCGKIVFKQCKIKFLSRSHYACTSNRTLFMLCETRDSLDLSMHVEHSSVASFSVELICAFWTYI